jgi:hypothetical protein
LSGIVAWAVAFSLARGAGAEPRPAAPAWFPDRPIAWQEHDEGDVPAAPSKNDLQELEATLTLRDGMSGEVDRILSLEGPTPAIDVNAADEVPCSSWFCPRIHLRPLSLDELVAGPASPPPRLPLTVVKAKTEGAGTGVEVVDADKHRFLVKFDPRGHLGMTTSAEMIGNRVFHAAGYNVPGAYLVRLGPDDLLVDPHATTRLYAVQKRPLTAAMVRRQLAYVAREPDGRLRGVAIPWIEGQTLGGFDMKGTRSDDPNDRIAHERRRSLRASRVLYAWLSIFDPGPINTLDSYVAENGHHYVRHNFIDFSCAFGSATSGVQGLHHDGQYALEIGRSFGALFSLGLYHRPFEDQRLEYETMNRNYPAVGFLPAEDFDPDTFRDNRKNPAFMRMTDRDAYWGAKIVTAFSNDRIGALVAAAQIGEPDASFLEHALEVRRDIIGRRYLRTIAAVEEPEVSADGEAICFRDLAIARGAARADEVHYGIVVGDGRGSILSRFGQASSGERSCVPIAAAPTGTGYRVVEIRSRFEDGGNGKKTDGALSKATRVHLRWRAESARFAVVGLERDD